MKEPFNYGYFRIEKQQIKNSEKNEVTQSILLNQEGHVLRIFDGDVMIKEITKNVFFLIAPGNEKSLFIKNTENGIFMHEFDYKNGKMPFFKTGYLIENDLIIVNDASCDYLFSITEGKIISDGYDAITEKNGIIIISIELESGHYSGILNLKGDLINNSICFNELGVAFKINPENKIKSFQKIDWVATQLLIKKKKEERKNAMLNREYQVFTRKRKKLNNKES